MTTITVKLDHYASLFLDATQKMLKEILPNATDAEAYQLADILVFSFNYNFPHSAYYENNVNIVKE